MENCTSDKNVKNTVVDAPIQNNSQIYNFTRKFEENKSSSSPTSL